MFLWVGSIVGLLAFLAFYDFVTRIIYRYQAKRAGCGTVFISTAWPFGIRFLVNTLSANKRHETLEHFTQMIRKVESSKTFLIELLMSRHVITRDPENVKAVLATDFKSYSLGLRQWQVGAFLGDGIFTLSGEGWKHSRNLLRPQFSREQVAQIESLRNHSQSLEKHLNRGEFVDIQHLFHQLTMDTATEFLFGESVDSLNDSNTVVNGVSASQFVDDYTLCLDYSLNRVQAGPFYALVTSKKFRDAVARSRKFVDHFVQKALARPVDKEAQGSGYVFTWELAKVTRDPVVIRDQAFNVLLAGRDTTASLMSYTMWYLARHEDVWKKLREVVLEEFGTDTSTVTFESLKRCTYLLNIINEVLRLNPVVPRNFRTAIRDTKLPRGGGPNGDEPVLVKKGMQVIYSVYEIQRQPEIWGEDCTEFKPERWEGQVGRGWEFLPFNGGPRICLGQQFALTEACFTIMRLAQRYSRIELQDSSPVLQNEVRLTANVYGGVWVKLHRDEAFD